MRINVISAFGWTVFDDYFERERHVCYEFMGAGGDEGGFFVDGSGICISSFRRIYEGCESTFMRLVEQPYRIAPLDFQGL